MKILERKDIERMWREIVADFVASPPQDTGQYELRLTSGTSGSSPILIVRRHSPLQWSAGRRVQCSGSMGVRLQHVMNALLDEPDVPMRILALDNSDIESGLTPLMEDYAPDGMRGSYSMMLRAAEHMSEKTRGDVSTVVFGGERLTPSLQRAVAVLFPNAAFSSAYRAIEVGIISEEWCGHLSLNRYHPASGVEVEIQNPNEEGVGDILVSVHLDDKRRIEHYRTGDLGKFVSEPCPCGRNATFEIIGRNGFDYVKIAGATLRREEWDRVAQELRLFDDYRVEALSDLSNGQLVGSVLLKVYRKDGVGTTALAQEIAERFSSAVFVTPTRTYAQLVDAGLFLPLRVEFSITPFISGKKEVKIFEI